jgi:hypothetical protein
MPGVVGAHQVAGGVHQVRLAQAGAAVQQQRVVVAARVQRDLQRRRAAELVAAALDEVVEGVVLVEVAVEFRPRGAAARGGALTIGAGAGSRASEPTARVTGFGSPA